MTTAVAVVVDVDVSAVDDDYVLLVGVCLYSMLILYSVGETLPCSLHLSESLVAIAL